MLIFVKNQRALPRKSLFCFTFASVILNPKMSMSMEKQNKIDPKGVSKWIAIIVAILSAIAGALGESASGFVGGMLGI